MNRRNLFLFSLLSTGFAIALVMPGDTTAQPNRAAPLKIGMAKSFFNDLHELVIQIATEPFPKLLKETTGFNGVLSHDKDAFGTAAQLDKGELQFGVFQGHEFAWVQKVHPDLVPLMVVVNKQHDVRAYVIVRKDSPAKSIANLRGKKIDVPEGVKEHCRIFLSRKCSDNANSEFQSFFSKVVKSKTPLGSMDNVARGGADAALVDTISLAFYKDIKLAVFNNHLRVLGAIRSIPGRRDRVQERRRRRGDAQAVL